MPISADVLSTLPSFLRELLDNCPTAGDGLHFWIFKCARHLLAHFNEDAVYQLLRAKAACCGRPIGKLEREIVSQIRGASACRWQPRDPCAFARYQARNKRQERAATSKEKGIEP